MISNNMKNFINLKKTDQVTSCYFKQSVLCDLFILFGITIDIFYREF